MISFDLTKHSKFDVIRIYDTSITYVTVTLVTLHFKSRLVTPYPKNFHQAFD